MGDACPDGAAFATLTAAWAASWFKAELAMPRRMGSSEVPPTLASKGLHTEASILMLTVE